LKNAIRGLISRPSTQPLFLRLLKLCHAAFNYGGGQNVDSSGEIGALEFVRRTVKFSRPFTLFDVGANDGAYLHFALEVLGEQVKAYAFEPQSASFEVLDKRFANEPRVELMRVAVGNAAGSADLFFGKEGETTASLNSNSTQGQAFSEIVRLTTIDEVCAARGIEHIDLLKIDTEGYEMEVLLGGSVMIETGRVSSIQFEFGDTFLHTPFHFVDFWDLLSSRYRIYRILRHGLWEVPFYSPDLEIYKIANFLCMWRD
jgi:FkbM family methyltransferase